MHTDVEKHFSTLAEITDQVALLNSTYDSDLESAFIALESYLKKISVFDFDSLDERSQQEFLSHISFHRESVADIIAEARQLLLEERRDYLKRLVSYHKAWIRMCHQFEKRFASV